MSYEDEKKTIAEERSQTEEEVEAAFIEWLKTSLSDLWAAHNSTLDGWDRDDLKDILLQYYSASARRSGGGGKGDTWVGMIVGYGGRRDNMRKQRELAVEACELNLSNGLKFGIVNNDKNVGIGRTLFDNGSWVAVNSEDKRIHAETGTVESPPRWVIPINGGAANICLLNDNGSPKIGYLWRRTWICCVNKIEDFLTSGPRPTPMELECTFDAADTKLIMNVPISFRAEEEDAWGREGTILAARNIDPRYGLDWVPDDKLSIAESMFAPDQFIAQFVPVCRLEDYMDHHDQALNKVTLKNGNEIGPIFAVMGEVDYIQSDGREDAYAEGGARHPIVLTNQSLRREDPSNSGVWINLNATHVIDHNAHRVKKSDGWHDYQQGSRVWCVVQSRTWQSNTDGTINYSLEGLNVYALPLRSIVTEPPPNETNDIGQFDGFGGDKGGWQ